MEGPHKDKDKIDDCSVTIWNQWFLQATKIKLVQTDDANRKKADENFYKMDEESIVTIREELSDDFFALAETQIEAVRKLIDRLEDDQLDVQLQFKGYERERRRKEAEKRAEQINISNEEQSMEP